MSRPPTHAPGYNNMKTFEYLLPDEYEATVKCSNCGEWQIVAIKKGVTIKKALQRIPCRECNCCALEGQ